MLSARSPAEHVPTARAALARVGELPDLKALVIERDLPDVDAFDAVALFGEWCSIEDVPTIVVAATEDERAVQRSIESRCNAYFVEPDPVARAEMAALTIALLGRPNLG
jgi:PleD family two-component response regulator